MHLLHVRYKSEYLYPVSQRMVTMFLIAGFFSKYFTVATTFASYLPIRQVVVASSFFLPWLFVIEALF